MDFWKDKYMNRIETPQIEWDKQLLTKAPPNLKTAYIIKQISRGIKINHPEYFQRLTRNMLLGHATIDNNGLTTTSVTPIIFIYNSHTNCIEQFRYKKSLFDPRALSRIDHILKAKEADGHTIFYGGVARFSEKPFSAISISLINTLKTQELSDPQSELSMISRNISRHGSWILFPNGKDYIADISNRVHPDKQELKILKERLTIAKRKHYHISNSKSYNIHDNVAVMVNLIQERRVLEQQIDILQILSRS